MLAKSILPCKVTQVSGTRIQISLGAIVQPTTELMFNYKECSSHIPSHPFKYFFKCAQMYTHIHTCACIHIKMYATKNKKCIRTGTCTKSMAIVDLMSEWLYRVWKIRVEIQMYGMCIKMHDSTINQNQELYSNGTIYIQKKKKQKTEIQLGIQSNSLYIGPGVISFQITSPTNVCIE